MSHVAKHKKWQKFALFFLKISKYVHFLFSSKTKYLYKFLSLKLIFALFCSSFHAFSAFGELQLYMMKHSSFFQAIFLIILDF